MASDAKIALPYPSFASKTIAYSAQVTGDFSEVETKFNQHIDRGPFNAKDYGAKGDATTDDTSSIQAAINAATAAGGGVVLLPNGTYKITNTLTMKNGVTLQGNGRGSVLKPSFAVAGSPNRVIDNDWINGNSDLAIRDLRIRRDGGNVQHAILLNGVTNLVISKVYIDGTPQADSGLIAISGVGPTVRLVSKNIRIEGCVMQQSANYGVQFGTVVGGTITNCTFYDCYREVIGVEPESGEACSDITIVGNTIVGSATDAGSDTGLIVVTNTSGGTIKGVVVANNVVDGGDTPIASNPSPGIDILGADGVVVSGNVIRRAFGPGIEIGNAAAATAGVVVIGNQVIDCNAGANTSPTGSGITLRNATKTLVAGNYVKGASHTESLSESAGAGDNILYGNAFLDTTRFAGLSSTTAVALNKESGANSLYVGGDGQTPLFGVNGGGTTTRTFGWFTNRVGRWFMRLNNNEAGANSGSDLEIVARADDGSNLATVLTFIRSTTGVKFGTGPLGFFGATPATKPTVTTDLLDALQSLGLIASGAGDTPLDLTGGSFAAGQVTVKDGSDVVIGSTTGSKIGQALSKLGFFGATPVSKPGALTQTYSTADATLATPTSAAVTDAFGTADGTIADVGAAFSQATLNNNFQDIATAYNALRTDYLDLAQFVNSIVDELQSLGLVG